jgi:hypothetical protein
VAIAESEQFRVADPRGSVRSVELPRSNLTGAALCAALRLARGDDLTLFGRVLSDTDPSMSLKHAKCAPITIQYPSEPKPAENRVSMRAPPNPKPRTFEFMRQGNSWQRWSVVFDAGPGVGDAEAVLSDYLSVSFPPHFLVCSTVRLDRGVPLSAVPSHEIEIRMPELVPQSAVVRLLDMTEVVVDFREGPRSRIFATS